MENHKTKLVWTASQAACKKYGVQSIGRIIAENKIDALRMTYTTQNHSNIMELRKCLDEKLPSTPYMPSSGCVPFLLHFVGRRALLCAPGSSLELTPSQSISLTFVVDEYLEHDLNASLEKSTPLIVKLTNADQMVHLALGSTLNISYGSVELIITDILERSPKELKTLCRVAQSGAVHSGMEVLSPHISRDLFPLLPEDEKRLQDGFCGLADFVVIEGLRHKNEFLILKQALTGSQEQASLRHPSIPISDNIRSKDANLPPRLLLKIDSKRSLDMFSDLIDYVDGVFLSRAELGVDEHPYDLPILQKELIERCNHQSKIILVASELMHSMRTNANPTRAEVSDMANAAADGADALVLSQDVTDGPNANLLAAVSRETLVQSEQWEERRWSPFEKNLISSDDDAVTYGAMRVAEQVDVGVIVCFTEGGYTAMKLSAMRTPVKIVAMTCNKKIMRQMNLLRGVSAVVLESKLQMDLILEEAKRILVNNFGFKKGDKFVFVSLTASSVGPRDSNLFTLQEID